ncbi:MAG: imidazolonepropionase [Prevotella sp.]|jgi:imidazolonepropionase|nr:imidazolonepropionase [Prevotella sp.]
MKQGNLIIKNAAQLVTCSGFSAKKGRDMSELAIIENGTVVITDGIITFVDKDANCPPLSDFPDHIVMDAKGKAVLPGFVDSHTHFVFGGYREEEFSWRMRGDSYMSIMERGGGIHNTMTATRDASFDELKEAGYKRLDKMLEMGVTTVEGKSGYGMNKITELKQLDVMKALNKEHPVDIVSTFMGAHATPKEYKGREDDFLGYLIGEVMPEVKERDLADCCDIFCEKDVFDIEQSRRYLSVAKALGFNLKVHADEIVTLGGAELAVELEALSADHLLHASDKGIEKLASSNTVATLLPCTAFSLKEDYARGRYMIDLGCAVALATDLNPGSSFTNSIPLLFALACIYMRLSPEEAVTALTINGAAAIGKADKIGSIDVGKQGDIVILEYPSYKFLPYHIGMNIVEKTIKKGVVF